MPGSVDPVTVLLSRIHEADTSWLYQHMNSLTQLLAMSRLVKPLDGMPIKDYPGPRKTSVKACFMGVKRGFTNFVPPDVPRVSVAVCAIKNGDF